MSSAYRYVVFSVGKQPTSEEVAVLEKCANKLKCRYAVGVNNADGGLALAFDEPSFSTMCAANRGVFLQLLERWQVRGCEVSDRLLFIKKPTALQPMPGDSLLLYAEQNSDSQIKLKQLAAKEALGRAGLALHRTLAHRAWLGRVAKTVPYALMFLGGVLTIVAGIYMGQKLLDSPRERRHETIRRVTSDGMQESLGSQKTKDRKQGHEDE